MSLGIAKPVFISYAPKTASAAAEAVCKALGEERVFLDRNDIPYDENLPRAIGEALLGAQVVVVFADELYFTRRYCLAEMRLAVAPQDGLPHPAAYCRSAGPHSSG
jgi:hypothetical protein